MADKKKKVRRRTRVRIAGVSRVVEDEVKDEGADLVGQIENEYQLCLQFMRPKIQEWLVRLKLYNNQKRDADKVGDPLLYTVHQTVLASLYDDKLSVSFKGREEGDEEQAENLNALSEYDYPEMQKDEHDYSWDWDAAFFGRGLSLFSNFDVDSKTPIPETLDPTNFLRDPRASSVNGDRSGRGSMRFGGYEVRMTKAELKKNTEYFDVDKLKRGNEDLTSLIGDARRQRREAQGLTDVFNWENLTENYEYSIVRWFTHVGGKKYVVELGNNRTLLIRKQEIPWDRWPIIDRPFSPISHDWDGVSLPDIIEDKQRFRSVLINVLGDTVKADLNGMYLFHGDRFRKNQDFNFKFGKWIEVKGPGALADAAQPLQTKQAGAQTKFILDFLDASAQRATATPEIQQGQVTSERKTATELELVSSKVDTRYSLTAKVFGWSEKKFWRQWYAVYDEYFADELEEKIARIEGPFGSKWKPIGRKDIITGNSLGPDIEIESRILSEARKIRNYQMWSNYAVTALQDPNTDKTYLLRKLGKLLMSREEVERIIPLSIDEYQAKEAVEMLNRGDMPPITLEQDHRIFLRFLAGAKDSPMTRAYIQAQIYLLMQKRTSPEAFPMTEEERMMQLQGGSPDQPQQPVGAPPEGAVQMQ